MTGFITSLPIVRPSQTTRLCTANKRVYSPRWTRTRMQQGVAQSTVADTRTKQFLTRFKDLGKVRLVGRNEVAIMESIATFDKLFFATIRSGEYANLIDASINLDMHLLLSGISGARFEIGKARGGSNAPTYAIRLLGSDRETVVLSVFLQWDKDPSDVPGEAIEAWQRIKAEYCLEQDLFYF